MDSLLDGLLDPNHSSNGTSLIFINWKSCHNKNMMKLNAPFLCHAHRWIATHPGVEWDDVHQIISSFHPQKNLHVIKFENDKFSTLHHQSLSFGTQPTIAQDVLNAVTELIAKVALFPLSPGRKQPNQLANHLRMVCELCYLDSPTFIQQMACSKNGMQSKTRKEKMKMAKSFLQEVLAFLPSRIPHCSHLLLMKSFSSMEDPG